MGLVVDTFLGSLVQSCCGEGGTLQKSNTGMCSHVCFPCLQFLGSRLLCWELSEASPGLYALPRSKLLRFRYSSTPQRRRLGWACVLCPSKVQAAQVTRGLVSAVSETYHLPVPADQFSGCTTGAPSQVCCVSLLGS